MALKIKTAAEKNISSRFSYKFVGPNHENHAKAEHWRKNQAVP